MMYAKQSEASDQPKNDVSPVRSMARSPIGKSRLVPHLLRKMNTSARAHSCLLHRRIAGVGHPPCTRGQGREIHIILPIIARNISVPDRTDQSDSKNLEEKNCR